MTTQELFTKAAKYCAKRETSEFDIRNKLKNWGANEQQIEQIIQQLKQHNFIDNLRFATAFAHDKFKFNSWGKIKIQYKLREKHINQDIIEKALQTIDSDEYEKTLKKQLENKLKSLSNITDPLILRKKLTAFALNRGFEYELINKTIDQLLNNES